ncbi:MAG: M43 family zinc metalloprotease [Bacteroidales bacterium]|nr:M43 family zinc metalloprotease [Bacteroidales bacterium]
MIKNYILVLIIISNCFLIKAQNFKPIIADELILQKKVAENPDIINKYIEYENRFKLLIEKRQFDEIINKTDTLINGKRIIPTVVHVIHTYGIDNISDEQVKDAIEKINIDLSKQNADTALTYPLFKPRAANCAIELRLAKIDPNGNCTNGIEHIFDYRTNWAYFPLMKQYHWPTDKYLNVFAVNFIYPEGIALPEGAFIGGMSPFPPDNPLSQALTGGDPDIDGVLIRSDCLGTIGTATNTGNMGINLVNRTFTHEIGHYFNLYHTFQNLMLGLIPASSGCPSILAPYGDEVSDTPPVNAATQNTSLECYTPGSINTCNENPDEPDMIENYMDYQWGYCQNIFTNGQKARMDAVLSGIRKNLWSYENLVATGVLDTQNVICAPVPDFHSNYSVICPGDNVTFYNDSYNGPVENILWNFPGGNPETSTSPTPVVVYNQPGIYSVTLTVSNSAGSNSITKQNFIKVVDPSTIQMAPYYESFENGLNNAYNFINHGGNGWQITDTAAATGTKSLRVLNFNGNPPNSIDAFISYGINLTSLTTTSVPLKLKFKYAYAGKIIPGTFFTDADTSYDALKIYVSTNCGKSWIVKWNKSGQNLQTANPTQGSFRPTPSDWKQDSINIQVYLTQQQTNFQFKFEFKSNSGNNIYIDDIVIDNGSYTSISSYISDKFDFSIFPNPASNQAIISLTLFENCNVEADIVNLMGRSVASIIKNQSFNIGTYKFEINKNSLLGSGFYFIRLKCDGINYFKPLIFE